MTDEQINQSIAKACGWTDVHFSLAATDEFPTERRVVGIPAGHCTHNVVPNYCADLNAIAEAEEKLDYQQAESFADIMYNLCADQNRELENPMPWRFAVCHATACQRAEAFLRTLGKWEEVQG